VYVCASLHEGFGLPVLEAMACGAPVLCSDRGALPETLGDCGVLFDPADARGFAAALAGLAGDAARRAELAARGPRRVAEGFSWRRVAERTLAVHVEAVASRRG
jgi:alpha-1,3-rhamnosyl/mannosyltransferase